MNDKGALWAPLLLLEEADDFNGFSAGFNGFLILRG
jgi:hypothetical protein